VLILILVPNVLVNVAMIAAAAAAAGLTL